MRILKFGGKSLSTPEKVQKICKYIKKIYKNDKKIIIIVSAIGLTTNSLIEKSKKYYKKNVTERELAVLLSTGETESSALFSIAMNDCNVPSKSFQANQISLLTHGTYNYSLISSINKKILDENLEKNIVSVISGFQGINDKNEITTLGRGGSDTTAAAIASLYNCNLEIYSDFNGIFSGDPRIHKFKKFNSVSFSFMKKLSNSGAKVIEERAINIASDNNISIISKASNKPNNTGTIINQIEKDLISVSVQDNISVISIVFTNNNKMEFLIKNVLKLSKQYKIYNFSCKNFIIEISINTSDKINFIKDLSLKLNISSHKKQ